MGDSGHSSGASDDVNSGDFRYDAFISYRHADLDRRAAKWLHTALETYRVPHQIAQVIGDHDRIRVFRDEEELPASANLSQEIETALEASRFLIVVCSPRTPESKWVEQEIVRFRELRRGDRILALLIEGEPQHAFPKPLREIRLDPSDGGDGTDGERVIDVEPLAADIRPVMGESARARRRMAVMRLMACLLGCRFDDLRQRDQERHTRRVHRMAGAALALFVVMSALAVFALVQMNEANQQRKVAEEKSEESRQRLVALYTDSANRLLRDNDIGPAMLWYANALLEQPADSRGARMNRLRLGDFLRRYPRLKRCWWHGRPIVAAQFSGDGRRVMTVAADGRVNFWDTTTGEPASTSLALDKGLVAAAATEDFTRIATAHEDRTARIWDGETGKAVTPPLAHDHAIYQVAFRESGRILMTASRRFHPETLGEAFLWDAETGKSLPQPLPSEPLGSASWYSDDLKLAVRTSKGGTSVIWAEHLGVLSGQFVRMPLGTYRVAAFSSDGSRLFLGNQSAGGSVFDTEPFLRDPNLSIDEMKRRAQNRGANGNNKFKRQYSEAILCAAWNAEGDCVLVGHRDGHAQLLASRHARTGYFASLPIHHGGPVNAVAISPDGRSLLTGSSDGGVRLWDVSALRDDYKQFSVNYPVAVFQDESDGQVRTLSSKDGSIQRVLIEDGLLETEWKPAEGTKITRLVRCGDGTHVVALIDDRVVRRFNYRSRQWIGEPLVFESNVKLGPTSDDGTRIAMFSETDIAFWNLKTGQRIGSPIKKQGARFSKWVISGDGKRAALGYTFAKPAPKTEPNELPLFSGRLPTFYESKVFIVDLEEGRVTEKPIEQEHRISAMVFDADSRRLVVTSGFRIPGRDYTRGEARIWDPLTGKELAPPLLVNEWVLHAAFHPDREKLALSMDTYARVYDTKTLTPVTPKLNSKGSIWYSPDGQLLVTANPLSFRVWESSTGQPITQRISQNSVSQVQFLNEGRTLLTVSYSRVQIRNIESDPRPGQLLCDLTRLFTGRHLKAESGIAPMTREQMIDLTERIIR